MASDRKFLQDVEELIDIAHRAVGTNLRKLTRLILDLRAVDLARQTFQKRPQNRSSKNLKAV